MRPGILDSTVERFRTYVDEDIDARRHANGVFDAFFSAATAALILIDEELRCVRVNERLAALTGKPTSAHVGHPVGDVLPAELEPLLTDVLTTGRAIEKLPFELSGRSLVGTFFPVYGDARITGAGGILIDITEHKRLERELRAAIELRERVLAVVSHDLRNPLGTIQLAMSTMPSTARLDGGIAKRVDIAERATRVMETLIHDLLDIATIQTGKLTPQLTDASAEAIIEEAIALHAPLAHEKGLTIVDNTRLADGQVRCDRTRMMQLLGNLLGNAIKFCRSGDVITVGGTFEAHVLRLQIADTGPGIPPEDIPHLFEPYWSTARSRQRGTGLGLFICNAIVEAHGGQLTVESRVGEGTTFHITLPIA